VRRTPFVSASPAVVRSRGSLAARRRGSGGSFTASAGAPRQVLATGVSEGGLVVTLFAERHPEEIDGALATCGPLGGLRRQVDYIGDVRILFDYFFPGVLPGHPERTPLRVSRRWESVYHPRIRAVVRGRHRTALRLARTAGAAVDAGNRRSVAHTVVNALWYSDHAHRDLASRLGGNPYGNAGRRYSGSGEDRRLNRRVRRIRASRAARARLSAYEPSGALRIPLTTLHTRGDDVVPFAHQADYTARVESAGAAGLLVTRSVRRYGHCEFRTGELLGAFDELARRVRTIG
jgi:pimeloyl-ACP methyl ester carboxylesterase